MIAEVAANDGYLLQFVKARAIPCYGIEPTASTANAARQKDIEIVQDFLSTSLAQQLRNQGKTADLVVANNVLAHVPDINDFSNACRLLLKSSGVFTCEFPHLMNLIMQHQFDTIYHEHFSYLSFSTVIKIFAQNGLEVFDVEEIETHGGSLRVYAQRNDAGVHAVSNAVENLVNREISVGMTKIDFYKGFQDRSERVKNDFVAFLIEQKKLGKVVVGYGAAAKANTLLNFAGVKSDLLRYVVDRSPHKQSKFMPGSRIPIVSEDRVSIDNPDFIVIFPWNIKDEIMEQLSYLTKNGTKFVVAVPNLQIAE